MNSIGVFTYRWLIWVATLTGMLWLCNTSTLKLATKRVVDMLAFLWIVLVGFGYLALMFPTTAVPSLLQKLLPTGLAANQFINDLTIIRFAELQTFIEGTVPRPAAPLPATNGWGSTLGAAHAVLHPLVAARAVPPPAHHRMGDRGRRAVVPLAISTNRGAWLSIGLGLDLLRGPPRVPGRRPAPVRDVVRSACSCSTAVTLTPLSKSSRRAPRARPRRATRPRRRRLQARVREDPDSPVLGYAAPESADHSPPIGTHGLIWYMMFSHGFVGLAHPAHRAGALFCATFKARTPTALWAHICIFIAITQFPYYGLLPQIRARRRRRGDLLAGEPSAARRRADG